MIKYGCLILLIGINYCFGQNEHNIWYFGCNSGIDFNGSSPIPLTDGAMCAHEGNSSICTYNGDLLFYTDGMTVWNKNHDVMPNGSDLFGGGSSTQSSLIIKRPNFIDKYYIFTSDQMADEKGLRYSEVNLNLACGFGDVDSNKNILITTPVSEKVTAILHQNGIDYWIITQIYGTNSFHSYLLTSSGLNLTPVVSNIGQIVSGFGWTGYLKGSSDGNKIVSATAQTDTVQVFDFDKSTGILSNVIYLNNFSNSNYGVYGVEFSPNNSLLYLSEGGPISLNFIYQYNLLAGSPSLINNTRITIGSNSGFQNGALQIAPDGKIYLTAFGKTTLAVIENPDSIGLSCSFLNDEFYLGGEYASGGLPNRPNTLDNKPSFNASTFCIGDSTFFSIYNQNSVDSVFWDFGDPNSGLDNFSNLQNPIHQFSDTGVFNVQLIIYSGLLSDTIENFISIIGVPEFDLLTNDTTLCIGQSLILETHIECGDILWQDGSNSISYEVTESGQYSVEAYKNGCRVSDTIIVNFNQLPIINLGNDTTLCNGEILTLGPISGTSCHWQDYSSDSIYIVSSEGVYFVVISDDLCTSTDSIFVDFFNCDSNCCNTTFSIPNVFTPNSDNVNDLFILKLPYNYDFVELTILNRWGNVVFKTTNSNIVWDGEKSSDGVYFWILCFRTEYGKEAKQTGFVHLSR